MLWTNILLGFIILLLVRIFEGILAINKKLMSADYLMNLAKLYNGLEVDDDKVKDN